MKYYAGIGSRETPEDILKLMENIAMELSNDSQLWTLRSGGAKGADTAFQRGSEMISHIYKAKNATPDAIKIAMEHHPAPQHCNDYVKKLHGRNAIIILGPDLKTLVEFVVCWTYKGNLQGGTALGIRIAETNNIPVFNLALDEARELFERYVGNIEPTISLDEILKAA
jgi:hypothetical protein